MGMNSSVYLGPYLDVPNERKSVRRDRCGHDVPEGTTFCQVCGFKQADRFYDSLGITELDKMLDAFEVFGERLVRSIGCSTGPSEIMIPNVGFGLDRESHFDPKCEQMVQAVKLSEQVREEAAFISAFGEEISKIREVQPDARVKWGMVMWMS